MNGIKRLVKSNMNKLFNENNGSVIQLVNELNESGFFNFVITEDNCLAFYQVYLELKKCDSCQGLKNCPLASKGYHPIIKDDQILYSPCQYKKIELNKLIEADRIDAMYMPKKVLSADIHDYHIDSDDRLKCYKYAMRFLSGEEKLGMYVVGPFGVGKTYLFASIANELGKRGKTALLVYFPDLARDLKSSIDSGDLENRIDKLKKVDVLLIDDIGSENMTSWVRDEILSPILNYRFLDDLPTFFSSNLDLKQLADHLSNTKDGKDSRKGPRIVQRIISMTKAFEVKK